MILLWSFSSRNHYSAKKKILFPNSQTLFMGISSLAWHRLVFLTNDVRILDWCCSFSASIRHVTFSAFFISVAKSLLKSSVSFCIWSNDFLQRQSKSKAGLIGSSVAYSKQFCVKPQSGPAVDLCCSFDCNLCLSHCRWISVLWWCWEQTSSRYTLLSHSYCIHPKPTTRIKTIDQSECDIFRDLSRFSSPQQE